MTSRRPSVLRKAGRDSPRFEMVTPIYSSDLKKSFLTLDVRSSCHSSTHVHANPTIFNSLSTLDLNDSDDSDTDLVGFDTQLMHNPTGSFADLCWEESTDDESVESCKTRTSSGSGYSTSWPAFAAIPGSISDEDFFEDRRSPRIFWARAVDRWQTPIKPPQPLSPYMAQEPIIESKITLVDVPPPHSLHYYRPPNPNEAIGYFPIPPQRDPKAVPTRKKGVLGRVVTLMKRR